MVITIPYILKGMGKITYPIKTITLYLLLSSILISCFQNKATDHEGKKERPLDEGLILSKEIPRRHLIYKPPEKMKGEEILEIDFLKISVGETDSILKSLLALDQEYRIKSVTLRRVRPHDQTLGVYGKKMKQADSLNYVILSRIIKELGWPSNNIFSDSAIAAPYYILLHTIGDSIGRFTVSLESAFKTKDISPEHYAVLMDRIELSKGKNQIYGTHCRSHPDGTFVRYKIEDIQWVEKNRQEIGLPALKDNTCELVRY